MSTTRRRQRKRQVARSEPRGQFSRSLRSAVQLIHSGDHAAGLTALDTLASSTRNPRRRAKILLLIAESESTLSRHHEAAAAYTSAANLARQAADLELLLTASTGHVRSLLRSLRTEDAIIAANELLAELENAQQNLNETLALTPDELAAQGPVEIPARPPRPTVGLTKLAHAFLQSGHTDQARAFLNKAIELSPNGASRARQALATLALASDDPALAERYAREALLMGRFQAKTIAAWPLYLNARARQSLSPILEPDVLAAFRTHANGRIAAAEDLEAWGKATWAMARMEALLENHAEAAYWYLDLAANPQTPPRFRIQAMLRGLRHLGRSGDNSTDIGQLSENIRSILNSSDDFRILLDAARQLALAGSAFTQLKNEAADRGTDLADQAIAAAATPQEQLTHLEYLARKLYWDLGRTRQLIQRWEKLTEKQKADYHATGGSTWYEYLSLVFLSLTETDRIPEATALASSILDHDTATPEGYVILGSTYAEHLLHQGQKENAFEFFDWIAKEAPTHRRAATAHYWLALRARANNLPDPDISLVFQCLSPRPVFRSETSLWIKATIHINGVANKDPSIIMMNDKNLLENSLSEYRANYSYILK